MSRATDRAFNFSAGPAVLPVTVLEQVQADLLALPGCGASILEISHRSSAFRDILADARQRLGELLGLTADYDILFLQGGARLQFSMVPMNLLRGSSRGADYLVTGSWGKKALHEARREGAARAAWDGSAFQYDRLPGPADIQWAPAEYVHYTSNETIQGVQFAEPPATGDTPLVCDASSDFLSRPLDAARHGVIYACAQKNAGPAGVTIVIIRRDLLERSGDDLPGYLNYREHAREDSLYNTPCTFGIYIVGLVARWLQEEIGGLQAMAQRNAAKSRLLYDVIDNSEGFYQGHAQPACRSRMNVTFRLPTAELEAEFLAAAGRQRLTNLKGHRSVGGIRASIYNAMPEQGVELLRDFMSEFAEQHASRETA